VIFELLRWRRAYLLVSPSWSHECDRLAQRAAQRIRRHRIWYGDHRITYLCNTPSEVDHFRRFGVDAVFCNQNALLDERIFFPDPAVEKRFDAIYDASFIAYKRHHLASKVERLALTGYVKSDSVDDYVESLAGVLPQAHWFKSPVGGHGDWLTDGSINRFLNECRVGLCLSAEEGAMYTSAQYLLAGLPVVTTRNKGGRDVFFHPDHVRWVDDDPGSVAEAVAELAANPPDPWSVRSRVLDAMAEHRARLVALLNDIYRRERRSVAWADRWPARLPNKLFDHQRPLHTLLWPLLARRTT
jgi:hypothetical protein